MMALGWLWIPLALAMAVAMDFWAALLHGRVWHTWLWRIHKTHHRSRKGRFETNDALSLLHAPISIALIVWGTSAPAEPTFMRAVAFGLGLGMALFGAGYLIVHDGIVHARLPVSRLAKLPWLREVVRAHRIHHAGARGGAPYGLFFGPWELARASRRRAGNEGPGEGVTPPRGAAES